MAGTETEVAVYGATDTDLEADGSERQEEALRYAALDDSDHASSQPQLPIATEDAPYGKYGGKSAAAKKKQRRDNFGKARSEDSQKVLAKKSSFITEYPHLMMPVTLDDVQPKRSEIPHLRARYMDYSRVVFAIGGFFFSTGMQWSLSKSAMATLDERMEQCHHNKLCNMASNRTLNGDDSWFFWMGFNPDMVWSNGVYLLVGVLIWVFASSHRPKDSLFRPSGSASQVEVDKIASVASAPKVSTWTGWNLRPTRITEAIGHTDSDDSPVRERDSEGSKKSRVSSHPSSSTKKKRPLWYKTKKLTKKVLRIALVGSSSHQLTVEEAERSGLFGPVLPGMYILTGSAIFVEGLLSGLYHTCPSSDFQQFDYVGITICEIAIFLMMWSKCHPKLPAPGSFALYVGFWGCLSAMETSSKVKNKPYVWAFMWVTIFLGVPVGAGSMHFSLGRLISVSEMGIVISRILAKGQRFERSTIFALAGVVLFTVAQIGHIGSGEDWHHKSIIGGAWFVTVLSLLTVCLVVKWKKGDVIAEMEAAGEEGIFMENNRLSGVEAIMIRKKLTDKQHKWRPIRVAVILLWWFMGFNTCLKGILNPQDYNLAHGVMFWHGQGAFLYYMYWFCGMVYFGLIEFTNPAFWGRLLRLAFYFFCMLACAFQGAEYFVNDSYKANAGVFSSDIDCESVKNGVRFKDKSKCTFANVEASHPHITALMRQQQSGASIQDQYPCGMRDGKFLCLIGSLDYNKECILSGLDGHSIWHFLSAISLFVLPLSIMVVDQLLQEKKRSQIAVL